MILDTIKKEIEKSGKSRYQIAKESGVSESQLCKIMQGKTVYCETADILLKHFGLEVKPKKKKEKLIGFEFGRKTTKVVIGKKKKVNR